MKINFAAQTVSMAKTFSFEEMATLEDMLQTSAFEASESGNQEKAIQVMELAETFGIEIEVDLITPAQVETILTDGDKESPNAEEVE